MELNLKKPLLVLAVCAAIAYYIRTHYTYQDVLAYAKKHPELAAGPALDYGVGMAYYLRGDYGRATEAFTQLLTDYTTTQYTARGLLRLGQSHEETFQWQGARDAYTQYLERFPDGRDRDLVASKYEYIKFK